MARLVVALSHVGTIQDVANFLHTSWDTVKGIQKRHLTQRYSNPDISGTKRIGIDEFAVAKGHVYKTRLDNALAMNKDLFVAYYLKEDLKEIWDQLNRVR